MNKDVKNKNNNTTTATTLLCSIILMLLFASGARAQSYIGLRGGYGVGSARFLPAKETGMVAGLMSGGLSYKYFGQSRFVGAIEVDLQYFQRGYKYDLLKDSDSSYMRTVNSIDLPLMWHPHVYIFNRKGRVFFNLGLNLTYNINSYEKYSSKQEGVYQQGDYPFVLVRDNRWGYGLVGGVGFSIFLNRFEFMAEGRYYYGYSDILKNYNKYPDNPMRSPVDNINVSVGVYYRLGKGGIKAPPSKRYVLNLDDVQAADSISRQLILETQIQADSIDQQTTIIDEQ